jgi:hypothetical protein
LIARNREKYGTLRYPEGHCQYRQRPKTRTTTPTSTLQTP